MRQLRLDLGVSRHAPPAGLRPMFARRGADLDAGEWRCDPSWAGVRVLAFRDGEARVRLVATAGRELGPLFPEVVAALSDARLPAAVLDAEIVVPGRDGGHDAAALRGRLAAARDPARRTGGSPRAPAPAAALVVADLLWLEGRSLLREPLVRRREQLARAVPALPHVVPLAPIAERPGVLAAALADGPLPALLAKRADSPYLPGARSRLWQRLDLRLAPAAAPRGEPAPADSATTAPIHLAMLLRLPLG